MADRHSVMLWLADWPTTACCFVAIGRPNHPTILCRC